MPIRGERGIGKRDPRRILFDRDRTSRGFFLWAGKWEVISLSTRPACRFGASYNDRKFQTPNIQTVGVREKGLLLLYRNSTPDQAITSRTPYLSIVQQESGQMLPDNLRRGLEYCTYACRRLKMRSFVTRSPLIISSLSSGVRSSTSHMKQPENGLKIK